MDFSEKILSWYQENKRSLPWRNSRDPYRIWLSEIMLQQTRVAQGLPYYKKFIKAFPTVYKMAEASEDEILKLWQGLGYYSRARNMHATAKTIVKDYHGVFPVTHAELLKLKGVGDYTASAIASICFDEPEPVVDGNVYRVLARYFGVDLPINSTKGIKHFKTLARAVMNTGNIRDYNQGIMEFGAIQCAPKKPYCLHCPLNDSCKALQQNQVHELPVKLKKGAIKKRFFHYLVPLDSNGDTYLEQRLGKGIWQNLYQFPLMEQPLGHSVNPEDIANRFPKNGIRQLVKYNASPVIHKLSHQHLYTTFWVVHLEGLLSNGIPWENLTDYAVPVLLAEFIKTYKI